MTIVVRVLHSYYFFHSAIVSCNHYSNTFNGDAVL